ncbi:helix-turn-helix domain-containing protein [Catellatospora sp. KI3]|uniref:helix-turn-helix domain-containing protein n=1 Tax=Catellatospora sp. KI3 TaxID=3041620 RepID=UPI0024823185|nr:helix-turn-helix domain-containing protein [Catellatospora sp. KI3]MDI1464793.1 helix-turn-helix domain-containing protein [Catellatospora sp. KI3]
MSHNLLLRLRLQRGMTQEELSEQSGISVRTIRNFERGSIQHPRRSSVDMLLSILDPDLKQRLWSSSVPASCRPADIMAERLRLADPAAGPWRGGRAPGTSLIGREDEVDRLADLVTAHQVLVLTGPGGVGKSRVARAVAERAGRWFAAGIAVVELGRIPADRGTDPDHVFEAAQAAVTAVAGDSARSSGDRLLLILDNAEHLVWTLSLLVPQLLGERPGLHVVITSRRPPVLPGAAIWELAPPAEPAAVELLLDRARTGCPTLDLAAERPGLIELVRRLDCLPRLVELAAYRLRLVPLAALLADNRWLHSLGWADGTALPHQRSLAASLDWSLDLLDDRHRRLLLRLADRHRPGDPFSSGDLAHEEDEFGQAPELLAELAESSLLLVDRGRRYEFRLLRHVQAMLAEAPGRWAGTRPPAVSAV